MVKIFFWLFTWKRRSSNKKFTIENIPKICFVFQNCTQLTKIIYSKIINKIVLVKYWDCKFTKIFENTFRSVNIALVNEMKILCHKLKLNIFDIINAAKQNHLVSNHSIWTWCWWSLYTCRSILLGCKKKMKLNFVQLANINRKMLG